MSILRAPLHDPAHLAAEIEAVVNALYGPAKAADNGCKSNHPGPKLLPCCKG
jgi:hypothetical protein